MNCGVKTHDYDCLCDVIVKEVTPINYGLPDYLLGGRWVASRLGIGTPWTATSFVEFMEAYLKAWDIYAKPVDDGSRMKSLKKMNPMQFEDLKRMVRLGYEPRTCVDEMHALHGVEISRSYICKLRKRMQARGEFNANQ